MLAMVNFHRLGINMRLQSIESHTGDREAYKPFYFL